MGSSFAASDWAGSVGLLAVYVAPVSNAIDCDNSSPVVNGVEDAIITGPYTIAVTGPFELLHTYGARIFLQFADMFLYRPGVWRNKLEEIFLRFVFDDDGIGYAFTFSSFRLLL